MVKLRFYIYVIIALASGLLLWVNLPFLTQSPQGTFSVENQDNDQDNKYTEQYVNTEKKAGKAEDNVLEIAPKKPSLKIMPENKIAPNLKAPDINVPGDNNPVVLNIILRSPGDAAAFTEQVAKAGGKVLSGGTDDSRFLRVEVSSGSVSGIAALEQVIFIEKYEKPRLLNDRASGITGALPLGVAGFVLTEGLTGRGQIVAVADTGLDTGMKNNLHPDFSGGKVVGLTSLYSDGPPRDMVGHGTHVAGTVTGDGAASGEKFKGIAPGAGLYIQSIINDKNEAVAPVELRQLFSPAYKAGARIHVNSWGGESNNYLSSSMQVDEFMRDYPDFLVLFGAGNSGPDKGTLSPEANSKNALVVGATENSRPGFGRDADNPGEVAGLSSRGPAGDGRIKPDLVAPGTSIISTASSLVKDEYALDKYYTRKSGTSMATAVAAGAAALLREYFIADEELDAPSAALIKAALVNGARKLNEDVMATGFGLIDVQNTVLALREKTMSYVDNRSGLVNGGSEEYTYLVTKGDASLKVTLAWTDPAAQPGSGATLVNDLNLVVLDPRGRIYYGNDFKNLGKTDNINNIEQVNIPDLEPGRYLIKVEGENIVKKAAAGNHNGVPAQDFALVYGTSLKHGVVARADNQDKFFLLDNGRLAIRDRDTPLLLAVNGWAGGENIVRPGADMYMVGDLGHPEKIYASYNTDMLKSVRGVSLEGGGYLMELNRDVGGGYGLAAGEPGPLLLVNGKETRDSGDIISGSSVRVTVNPSTGRVWQVDAFYKVLEGYLKLINGQKISLRGDTMEYVMDHEVTVYRHLDWQEQLPYWTPFSHPQAGSIESLKPGDRIRLVVVPDTGQVTYIEYHQGMLAGVLAGYDRETQRITFTNGQVYNLVSSARIFRDGREAAMGDLTPGDHLEAELLPDLSRVWRIDAYSRVLLGRVIYFNDVVGTIVVFSETGQHSVFPVKPRAPVFWQGKEMGNAVLQEGDYVRLALDGTKRVWRIDVATPVGEPVQETEFVQYNPETALLTAGNGETYLVTARTLVTKDDIPVRPEDLLPGEKVKVTAVVPAVGDEKVLGMLQAQSHLGVSGPPLEVDAPKYVEEPEVLLSGRTAPGSRLRIYVNDRLQENVSVADDGNFSCEPALPEKGTSRITVVVVDPNTGGVTSQTAHVYWAGDRINMADLKGHWAENEIREFITRGVVKGYSDGLFRPDQPVSRVEFVRMMVGALGWSIKPGASPSFSDTGNIAPADRPFVALAAARGLLLGYPEDNTFRPDRTITRAEMAVIIYRALQFKGAAESVTISRDRAPVPGDKLAEIPPWAREESVYLYDTGIMTGRGDGFFPMAQATRAEAVVVLSRINKFTNIITPA